MSSTLFGRGFFFVLLVWMGCLSTDGASANEIDDALLSRIEQYVEQAHQDWQVPGVAIAVVRSDSVVLSRGFGFRKVGTEARVDENTLFAIASNTKAFTAAAIAMLVEEGKIHWDDPVQKHLPGFRLYDRYVSADIRVRDLLCHRSGLGTFSGDLLWYGTTYQPREILERIRYLPQAGEFGRSYGYSNLMFLAAGEIISETSGESWNHFVQSRILDPLQMKRTLTSTRGLAGTDNVAVPHKTTVDDNIPLEWVNWDNAASVGGIISSTADMSRWLMLQLRHGQTKDGARLFSESSSREMWKPHTLMNISAVYQQRNPSTHFRAYGLGWSMRDYKGRKVISHGGGYDGMYSRVVLVPELDFGVVVLTNSMTSLPSAVCNRILDEFLGGDVRDWSRLMLTEFRDDRKQFDERVRKSISPAVTGTAPSLPPEKYAGTYRDVMYGEAVIKNVDGRLSLSFAVNPHLSANLTHMHLNTFAVRWNRTVAWFESGNLQFRLDNKTNVTSFVLDIPNDDFWFYEHEFARVR